VRIPRSRGAVSGLLLVVLGAWGALVPFIGPAIGLTIGPDTTFEMTAGRFWLSLLPGVVVALGGLMTLTSANRASAVLGAQLALAGGLWFLVGPTLSHAWSDMPGALGQAGFAKGGEARRSLEVLLYFYGIGAAITTLAALALGRLSVRSVRDVEYAADYAGDGTVDGPRRTGRFVRDRDRDRDGVPDREPVAVGAGTRDEGAVRGPSDRIHDDLTLSPQRDEGTVRGPRDRLRDKLNRWR
jgi:hypothetical protein